MPQKTITYSPSSEGWTSFWSYFPDWMDGMNNTFYSWKDGSLYQHDTNATRNNFYGVQYDSEVTTLLNTDPTTVKMFKTLAVDSNEAWKAEISTDLNTGLIEADQFVDKEGHFFAYVRRLTGDQDYKAISSQGVGECLTYSTGVLTFAYNIDTSISIGDTLFYFDNGTNALVAIGAITALTNNSITVATVLSAPSPGDFIAYTKNSVAESYGARGYYAEVKLTNDSTSEVELFEISSNVFKSNP